MSSRFEIIETPLEGPKLILRKRAGDQRGYLERLFCVEELQPLIPGKSIVQINRTSTAKMGTVRGLHFQYPPHAETKIVSCLRGEVFDVAVDLRLASRAFPHWHREILSDLIQEGFAHGFQSLTADCEKLYFHTATYHLAAEGDLNAQDRRLNILWPATVTELSSRDAAHPAVTEAFVGVAK